MRLLRLLTALLFLSLLETAPADALDPHRSLLQFKHTSWSVDQGAPANIYTIAQDRTGFLWISARDGFFRFDGLTFEPIPLVHATNPTDRATDFLVRRDGSILAALWKGSVAVYRRGGFREVPALDMKLPIVTFGEDDRGALWFGLGDAYDNQIARFEAGHRRYYGRAQGLPNDQLVSLLIARDGTIWAGFHLGAVLVLTPGAAKFTPAPIVSRGHGAVTQDQAGRIWTSDDIGTRQIWANGAYILNSRIYPSPRFDRATQAFWDGDHNLWFTDGGKGIARLTDPLGSPASHYGPAPGSLEPYTAAQGLTSDATNTILPDREGSVWIATSAGLDRIRATDFVVEPQLVDVPSLGDVLLGTTVGDVYIAERTKLYRAEPNRSPRPVLSYESDPEAMCERVDGSVAVVFDDRIALFKGGRVRWIAGPPHLDDRLHYGCADDPKGNLWVSSGPNGLFEWTNGRWSSRLASDRNLGLSSTLLASDGRHRMALLRAPTRLSDLTPPVLRTVSIGRGTPIDAIESMTWTPEGLLAAGPFGMALWRGARLEVMPAAYSPLPRHTYAMTQSADGDTWARATGGIVRISKAQLLASLRIGRNQLTPAFFSHENGVDEASVRGNHQGAAVGGDGRVWFGGRLGTRWVDPHHLVRDGAAPGVAITAVVVDGTRHRDPTSLPLSAGASNLEIDFAGLDVSRPSRVHVQYRLEGVDKDWIDPGTRRSAFYTNLGPGDYAFQVRATGEGTPGASVARASIHIPPTFLQSIWFKLLCAVPVGLLVWTAYRLRVEFLTGRMRNLLETRLAERERIARELHDTLLQGFQGLIFHIQSIANRVPRDQPVRGAMEEALDRADAMMVEGRRRVQDLRTRRSAARIDAFLTELGETLAKDHGAGFRLTVEGRYRDLQPLAADEAEAVATEAMRNAFRHGGAKLVDVVIGFHGGEFQLVVSDDGRGLPPDVAAAGERAGHYGLSGMRERAERIRGKLVIASRPGSGTVVSLSIPATAAYPRRVGVRPRPTPRPASLITFPDDGLRT